MSDSNIQRLLDSYPRQRPPLSTAHQRIFEAEYRQNREGKTLITHFTQKLESWMHKKVASIHSERVLELGAGTLNHVPYEEVAHYDIVEPFKTLFLTSPYLNRIQNIYDSIHAIPGQNCYPRIISVAVLEHVLDLPAVIHKAHELLEPQGVFQAGIPCEGGFLWGLSWRLTTGIAYRLRTGLSYRTVMRHEHVNRCDEIITLVRHAFNNIKIDYFPLPFVHGAFYAYIEARKEA